MENLALHTSNVSGFSGYSRPIEGAQYVVVGVPYDYTSTFRAGSRFAPRAIRDASLNIETYSLETEIDVESIPLHDTGDLHVVDDASETLRRLQKVTEDILSAKKTPVCIGGEHTVTLGAVRSLPKNVGVVSFDAHGDLRDEYGGEKLSHATVLRRITEIVGTDGVFVCGIRAVCKEEIEFIKQAKIGSMTPSDIRKIGVSNAQIRLKSFLERFQYTYLTIDADVLDPAYCPGVANPEFNGLTPSELLPLVATVAEQRLIGFDLVEVCPIYDTGNAAVAAARLIFETLAHAEKSKITRRF
jgi:agmatinase